MINLIEKQLTFFEQGLAVASTTSEVYSVMLVNRATCLIRSGTHLNDASRDLALAEASHTYPASTLYKLHLQKSECARLMGLDEDAIICMIVLCVGESVHIRQMR